jgi:hypothetical protein
VELIGPYLVAGAVLVAAGLAKAWRPADSARALAGPIHLPVRVLRPGLRAAGAAEALVGAVAVGTLARPAAALVAASYALFAAVVLVVRHRGGPLASCGCLGTPDTPATLLHVVVDLGLAAAAVSVAGVSGVPRHPQLASGPPRWRTTSTTAAKRA